LNRRQAWWILYLSRFDFTLKHVLGTKMEKMNRLSKRPDWKVGVKNDNNNQILIKKQWVHSLAEVVIEGSEVDIIEKIKIAREKNEEIVRVVEKMKKAGVKVLWEDKWQIKGDFMLKKENVYVLKNEALKVKIIWLYHNILSAWYGGK